MRNKIIQVRATQEEYNLIMKASELQGLQINSFTRSMVIEKSRCILRTNNIGVEN